YLITLFCQNLNFSLSESETGGNNNTPRMAVNNPAPIEPCANAPIPPSIKNTPKTYFTVFIRLNIKLKITFHFFNLLPVPESNLYSIKKRGTKAYALKVRPSTHSTNRNSPRQSVSVITIYFCRIVLKFGRFEGTSKS